MSTTKLRAKRHADVTQAIALINHPMTSGLLTTNSTDQRKPCHFITDIMATHNGETVITAQWSGAMSENPFFAFRFKGGEKGDTVKVEWLDNQGNNGEASTLIR